MSNQYHYTGENIPNANPIGLEETKQAGAALALAAKIEGEALARHLGGKDKVVNHPAVAPEMVVEDPSLRGLNMPTEDLDPDFDGTPPSPYDNLKGIERDDDLIVDQVRGQMRARGQASMTPSEPDNILPEYNWKSLPEREYFEKQKSPVDKKRLGGGKNKQPNNRNTFLWIGVIAIAIIAIVAIVLFIYGIHRHKKTADILKPNQYHIVSPEYIPTGTYPDYTGLSTHLK